jgi:putative ABC transport system permease protein
MSYSTSQRTREFGIRMALGSPRKSIVGLVLRKGMELFGIGLGLGAFTGFCLGRLLARRLSGVASFDLLIFATIGGVVLVTCLAACLLPAWRAVRIPPAIALRSS